MRRRRMQKAADPDDGGRELPWNVMCITSGTGDRGQVDGLDRPWPGTGPLQHVPQASACSASGDHRACHLSAGAQLRYSVGSAAEVIPNNEQRAGCPVPETSLNDSSIKLCIWPVGTGAEE